MSGAEVDFKQETLSRFIKSLVDTSPSSTGMVQSLLTQHKEWILKAQDKNDGRTPMHHAVELPHRHNLLGTFLTECPESANMVDKKGQTPGHIVVKNCYKNAFDILWPKNAMISYDWDDDGFTMLHYACMTIFSDESNPSNLICADPGAPIILEKILVDRPALFLIISQDGQLPIDMLPDQRLKSLCDYYTLMGTQIVIEMASNGLFSDTANIHVMQERDNKYLPIDALDSPEKTQSALEVAKHVLSHESLQRHFREEQWFSMLISRLVPRWYEVEAPKYPTYYVKNTDDFGQPSVWYPNSSRLLLGYGGTPFTNSYPRTPANQRIRLPNQRIAFNFGKVIAITAHIERELRLFSGYNNFSRKSLQEELGVEEQKRESRSGDAANEETVLSLNKGRSHSQHEFKEAKSATGQEQCRKTKSQLELLIYQKDLHLSMAKKLYDYAGKIKNLCDGDLNAAVNDQLGQAFTAACKFADACDSIGSQYENSAVDGNQGNNDVACDNPGASEGENRVELLDVQMKKKTFDEMADVLFGFAEQMKSICGGSNDAVIELMKRALEGSRKANETVHTIAEML